jgi:sugar fermentation stimulation protein A
LAREALRQGYISELSEWDLVKAEVKMGSSRFDFLLARGETEQLLLEVKSVTLVEDGIGFFPDAVTERGARHVRELAEIAGQPDWEAAVLFVLQRPDAREIRAAKRIDPKFSEALIKAEEAGVKVFGRRCCVYLDRVELQGAVPVSVV